jgi:hypothetical protein
LRTVMVELVATEKTTPRPTEASAATVAPHH